jgi:Mrp family chromosome partitioning ATPase
MTQPSHADDVVQAAYRFSPQARIFETEPSSPTVVALQELAAEIIAQQVDAGRRGVVVCSPHLGAGTTFVATHLAIALSRAGVSVLLVDANLHAPGVSALIEPVEPTPGLSDLLKEGEASLERAIHREILPGLSIAYAGEPSPRAAELVASVHFDQLLRQALRDFEYTIVDTPPANRSIDALRCASLMGYAMIVARDGVTHVDDVSTLRQELLADGAVVVASVLNAR